MPDLTDAPTRKKRGPNTPAGKARSAMNALEHGLRAREFGSLPEEGQPDWAEHLADLRAGYGPVDATEEKLVTAIAVAMLNEIRADRNMAELPPCRPGRSHGTDLQDPEHRRSLGTAIRYMAAAGKATQRAQRAFLAHRKAKQAGHILPVSQPAAVPANQNGTNGFVAAGGDEARAEVEPQPHAENCTNEFRHCQGEAVPERRAVVRARLARALRSPADCAEPLLPEAAGLPLAGESGSGRWHARTRPAGMGIPIRAAAGG